MRWRRWLLCTAAFAHSVWALAAPVKIGFVLATMKEERYAKDKKYFTDKAKSLGAEVLFASADDNQRTQLEKVEDLLSRGVKAIVIQPVNANSAARLVIASHLDKVPVVAYDRMIKNADLDFYVTQDSFKVGVLQAEAAVKATNGKGNYVILCGEAGHTVADEITAGVLSVLKNHPNIKVVVQQSHEGWSSTKAMTTVENALTIHRNDIQAILANNSGMAQGAIQALAEQKLVGKVFVAGADADLIAIRNIVAGKQQFEVLKAIQPLAEKAAEVAVDLANHKTPQSTGTMNNGKKDVPVANTPVFPVTKENIQKQIIDYGFHTRQQVYGK